MEYMRIKRASCVDAEVQTDRDILKWFVCSRLKNLSSGSVGNRRTRRVIDGSVLDLEGHACFKEKDEKDV